MRTTYISLKPRPKRVQISSSFFKKRIVTISLGLTYLAGMIFGRTFAGGLEETNQTVATMLSGFFKNRASQNILENFLSSFISAEGCLIILFICGYCAIAAPVIYLMVFFRGLGPGLYMALLFTQTGWNGTLTSLIMLPGIVGTAIIIILSGKVSLQMSTNLFSDSSNGIRTPLKNITPRYCIQYLVFSAGVTLVSLIDGMLFYLFGGILPG